MKPHERFKSVRYSDAAWEHKVKQLRGVCAWAYQFAGAYDAPVEVLDILSAAANGDPIPDELPIINPPEKS